MPDYEASGTDDPVSRALDRLQLEARTPWDSARHDAFTFHLAMEHLGRARPRVLYIAFDETDDWAHDGRYEAVLDSLRPDRWLPARAVDVAPEPARLQGTHPPGRDDRSRARNHTPRTGGRTAAKTEGSQHTWIAFASPRLTQRGVWRDAPPLTTSQIAATIASWMGVDWTADHPGAGQPIR